MVRVAFTVALLVAVAGVVVPATEYAGVRRSDATVREAVDRIVGAARALAAGNDALAPDAAPARRSLSLALPTDGFASAGIERFIVGPPGRGVASGGASTATDATQFAWRVAGGTEHVVVVDGVRIRPETRRPLRSSGRRVRVVLELVAGDDGPVVRLRREG